MWDVVKNGLIRIEKINNAPPTERSTRSNTEEDKVDEEEEPLPPKPTRALKPSGGRKTMFSSS